MGKMDCYVPICLFGSYSKVNPTMYKATWKLVTNWLRNPRSTNSLHVSYHFSIHFFMFHLLFPPFLWVFPMFPLVFLPVFYFRSYAWQEEDFGDVLKYNKFWTILEKLFFRFLNLFKTLISEVHSEPCQTCKMESFAKILNEWSPLTLDAWQVPEYTFGFVKLTLNYRSWSSQTSAKLGFYLTQTIFLTATLKRLEGQFDPPPLWFFENCIF